MNIHMCSFMSKAFYTKPAGDDLDAPMRQLHTLELQPSVFDKTDVVYYKLKTLLRDYSLPDSAVVEGIEFFSQHYGLKYRSMEAHNAICCM